MLICEMYSTKVPGRCKYEEIALGLKRMDGNVLSMVLGATTSWANGRVFVPPTPSPNKGLVKGRPGGQLRRNVTGAGSRGWGSKGEWDIAFMAKPIHPSKIANGYARLGKG